MESLINVAASNPQLSQEAVDEAKNFVQRLLNPSVSELGWMIADKVKEWRFVRQVNSIGRIRKKVENAGFSPKQLNLKVLYPYLTAIGIEEDQTLQDMWENMIVNYIDPAVSLKTSVFPAILKQLCTDDVLVLRSIARDREDLKAKRESDHSWEIPVDPIAFANVLRLGLIDRNPSHGNEFYLNDVVYRPVTYVRKTQYVLSQFGYAFVKACERNDA